MTQKWENNRKTSTVFSLPVFFLYIYKWKWWFLQQNDDEKQNDYKFHGTLANCYSIELSTFCLVYGTHGAAIQWAFKTALIAVITSAFYTSACVETNEIKSLWVFFVWHIHKLPKSMTMLLCCKHNLFHFLHILNSYKLQALNQFTSLK